VCEGRNHGTVTLSSALQNNFVQVVLEKHPGENVSAQWSENMVCDWPEND